MPFRRQPAEYGTTGQRRVAHNAVRRVVRPLITAAARIKREKTQSAIRAARVAAPLTCSEEDYGLETAVLGGVDVQGFQLFDLLLKDTYMVHEGHYAVGGHRRRVQAGRGQQRCHVQRHRTLRRVQHEQLAPDQPQQRHLVGDLQVREERDVACPLDRAEQQPRGQLADRVSARKKNAR